MLLTGCASYHVNVLVYNIHAGADAADAREALNRDLGDADRGQQANTRRQCRDECCIHAIVRRHHPHARVRGGRTTRLHRAERNIAVAFMVDMSGSTRGWINEAEREALVLLAESLERLGDRARCDKCARQREGTALSSDGKSQRHLCEA